MENYWSFLSSITFGSFPQLLTFSSGASSSLTIASPPDPSRPLAVHLEGFRQMQSPFHHLSARLRIFLSGKY